MNSVPAQDPVVKAVNAILSPGVRFADWVVANTSRGVGVTVGLATMALGSAVAMGLSGPVAAVAGPLAVVPWLTGLYMMGAGVRIAFESYAAPRA
jgi:hypothetical protein